MLRLALATALAALLALPAAADASGVTSEGNELRYSAGPGETNAVTISIGTEFQNVAKIQDSVPIAPGTDCQQGSGPNEVTCFVTEDFAGTTVVELRDGNDSVSYSANGASVGGAVLRVLDGSGDDRVTGGSPEDTFVNGPGNDVLTCSGDTACKVLTGKVPGVAFYVPGLGDDRISGTVDADRLMGGAGNDRISGGAGNDRLYGGAGADVLNGGPGTDRLFGGGGPGQDVLRQ